MDEKLTKALETIEQGLAKLEKDLMEFDIKLMKRHLNG